MTEAQEREAFEKWLGRHASAPVLRGNEYLDGWHYEDREVQALWLAWKDGWQARGPSDYARGVKEERGALKYRIDLRLNNHLCDMKEGYDDSIVGFNEAWDLVRAIFAEAALSPTVERGNDK